MVGGSIQILPGSILAEICTALATVEATGRLPSGLVLGEFEIDRLFDDPEARSVLVFDRDPWTVFEFPILRSYQGSVLRVAVDS